jgi:hypothetical protein
MSSSGYQLQSLCSVPPVTVEIRIADLWRPGFEGHFMTRIQQNTYAKPSTSCDYLRQDTQLLVSLQASAFRLIGFCRQHASEKLILIGNMLPIQELAIRVNESRPQSQ